MNQWIWRELCTSQSKTLSAFNLSPHAWSLLKFIHWALNKFSIELKTYSEFSELISLLYSNIVTILRGFSSRIWLMTTRLCKARSRKVFQFQIFTQKWLSRNIKYLIRLEMKLLKSKGFRQNITLSKHWTATNKLFGSLDWSLMLGTSGIRKKNKKYHRYLAFSPFYPKIKTHHM